MSQNRNVRNWESAEIKTFGSSNFGISISINVSKNQMFGNRQFGLKPNDFGPELIMSEIETI